MTEKQDPREDFPLDTFKFMEKEIGKLRKEIMEKASEIARAECSHTDIEYTVTREHIQKVFKEVLKEFIK